MAEVDGQEKTEQPSEKKLRETREKGEVAKSVEINSLAIFLTGTAILYYSKSFIGGKVSSFTTYIFSSLNTLTINPDLLGDYTIKAVLFFFSILSPILIGLVIMSLAAGYGQTGFKIATKALALKFSFLNPVSGLKKVFFSSHSITELVKSLIKLTIISLFAYWVLKDTILDSAGLMGLTIPEIAEFMIDTAFKFIWKISLVYIVFAAIDFIYQKFQHNKKQMMTKKELKDEYKASDGDPLIKGKIKSKQMMMAKARMMQDVPKADVVITNPTHLAIALKYELGSKFAPKVLAKGADEIAQKIKEIATKHNIPLHEDVELARALFKHCDVGDEIPTNLFKAVAQVLAYIFNLKNAKKKKTIV
ncbi:MAG: flagellar biosynthesis protein FlhB [Ignavibacteriales bacterium]|nr:flagellar biosynthesis protein FlhB [Ignavibacteriales bacterium]